MSPTRPQIEPRFEIGALPHSGIDDIVASIVRTATRSPIVRTAPVATLSGRLAQDLPRSGAPLAAVLDEVRAVAVDHARRNAHPGFYGYVAGPGLPTDPLAHAIVGALNQNVIGFPGAPGPVTVERTVLGWMRQLAGLPDDADGAIVSCGSVANLSGLTVALYSALGGAYLDRGLTALKEGRPVMVASRIAHFSMQRAAVLLGIGLDNVRLVEHDGRFRMRPDRLAAVLDDCDRRGERVVCVVGTAGATVTGSIDPLDAIADVCRERGIWLHVDAAYGGAGLLSPKLRPAFSGIERADSVCMDLHKWFYLGFDGSVVLYREPDRARNVFYARSDYVHFPKDGAPEEHMFFHYSPELSRRFRALPAYVAFRYYGGELLGRNVEHNHECARYLADMVEEAEDLELINRPELSICCFRYRPPALAAMPERVDELNAAIRAALQEDGDFLMSPTDVSGRPVLRVCICSHATRATHMEDLLRRVREKGRALSKST